MTFNLDLALFYAYTLTLFAFLALWLLSQVLRALVDSANAKNAPTGRSEELPPPRPRPLTRLEAFTRI